MKLVLAETPAARQRTHLGLLGLSAPAQIDAVTLSSRFALDVALIISGTGMFARRLEAFVYERGL
ncbi:hypothetical protein HC891_01880 [Candidatus Gracilibacteria bacterium]|nr:hypothetical protein [Candidatus Gracilibacteria bacterium]